MKDIFKIISAILALILVLLLGFKNQSKECPSGYLMCNDECVNVQIDNRHCGKCSNICSNGQRCEKGDCVQTCPDATPTKCFGGCVDLDTNPLHCGKCGNQCPPGQQCLSGACSCPAGMQWCNTKDKCVDISEDNNHCGGCNRKCPPGQRCKEGRCAPSCPSPTPTPCFGGCVNLQNNNDHCGECGNKCPPGTCCQNGKCQ